MGVHESQSLLWERMVALGRPFSRYLAPKLAAAFPQLSDKLSPDTLYGSSHDTNPLRHRSLDMQIATLTHIHALHGQTALSQNKEVFIRVRLHAVHPRLRLMCLLRAAGAMQVR